MSDTSSSNTSGPDKSVKHILQKKYHSLHDDSHKGALVFNMSANTMEHQVAFTTHSSNSTQIRMDVDESVVLDRQVFLQCDMYVDIEASAVNQTVNKEDIEALVPAQFPLHRCMQNLNVSLNGYAISTPVSDYINPLLKYVSDDELERFNSMTPAQPDAYNTMDMAWRSSYKKNILPTFTITTTASATNPTDVELQAIANGILAQFAGSSDFTITATGTPGAPTTAEIQAIVNGVITATGAVASFTAVTTTNAPTDVELQAVVDGTILAIYNYYVDGKRDFNSQFNAENPYSRRNFQLQNGIQTVTAASGSAKEKLRLHYRFTEALHHPYFSPSVNEDVLARIRTLSVNVTWRNLKAAFQMVGVIRDNANGVCTVTPSFDAGDKFAQLLARTSLPTVDIPEKFITDMHLIGEPRLFDVSGLSTTRNGTATVVTGSIAYSQVPDKLYIFCREKTPLGTSMNQVDSYARVDKIILRSSSTGESFSQASNQHLYEMSVKNGLNQSYDDWSVKQGSVVCVDYSAADVHSVSAGTRIPYNFTLSATVRNVSFNSHSVPAKHLFIDTSDTSALGTTRDTLAGWQLVVIPVFRSKMESSGNQMFVESGHDVEEVEAIMKSTKPEIYQARGLSGGFFGLGSLAKMIAKPALNIGKQLLLQTATQQLNKHLGSGVHASGLKVI